MSERKKDRLSGLSPQQKRDLLRRMLEERSQQGREFPLSQHQLGMWFLTRMAPGIASYNTALAVQASPPLDAAALSRALEKLTKRHAALRTVFIDRDGVPVQRVCENASVPVRSVNMSDASDEALRAAVTEDYRLPFDLGTSPLRVTLFRRENSDVLLLTVHHIVFDAWSANVLYKELRALYEAELRGVSAELSPLSAAYHNFVEWQSKMLESEGGKEHWRYWQERLSGELPTLDLPFRKALADSSSFVGKTIPLNIGDRPYGKLKDLVRDHKITVFSAVVAAYSILLHRLSRERELLIGTAVSGRTHALWANVIGDFINMLPLRLVFSGQERAENHLQAVSVEIRNALAHQDYPFPLMVERLRVRREPGRSPVFQAMVNVHVARSGSELSRLFDNHAMPFGDSSLRNYSFPQQEGQFDIALELLDTGEALVGGLRYSEEAFDEDAAAYMAGQLVSILGQMAAQPGSRISDYCIDPMMESTATEHFAI